MPRRSVASLRRVGVRCCYIVVGQALSRRPLHYYAGETAALGEPASLPTLLPGTQTLSLSPKNHGYPPAHPSGGGRATLQRCNTATLQPTLLAALPSPSHPSAPASGSLALCLLPVPGCFASPSTPTTTASRTTHTHTHAHATNSRYPAAALSSSSSSDACFRHPPSPQSTRQSINHRPPLLPLPPIAPRCLESALLCSAILSTASASAERNSPSATAPPRSRCCQPTHATNASEDDSDRAHEHSG